MQLANSTFALNHRYSTELNTNIATAAIECKCTGSCEYYWFLAAFVLCSWKHIHPPAKVNWNREIWGSIRTHVLYALNAVIYQKIYLFFSNFQRWKISQNESNDRNELIATSYWLLKGLISERKSQICLVHNMSFHLKIYIQLIYWREYISFP